MRVLCVRVCVCVCVCVAAEDWSAVRRDLVAQLAGKAPKRDSIVDFTWKLVDREAAVSAIDGIVAGAIYSFNDPAPRSGRFMNAVMLALSLPGIGKSRMLIELKDRHEAEMKSEFGDRFQGMINLVFTLNQAALEHEAKSIDALLGWRALRHFFCPDEPVDEFYRK